MNDLTRKIVFQVAKKHKREALENGERFADLVDSAWWDYLLGTYGWKMQEEALEKAKAERPDMFDEDGDLRDHVPWIADWAFTLSDEIVQALGERAESDPEMSLDDWGDLPVRLAQGKWEDEGVTLRLI